MVVSWKRGPQRDESGKFEVIADETEYSVIHTFSRASTLFRDKAGVMQKKESQLELASVSLETSTIIGSGEVDLGAYFGKVNEKIKVKLDNSKVDSNASISCIISVTELSKEEFKEASKGQVTNDITA